MANVLIVAYLLIVLALIAVILMQRSEGGALGIGGGGGGGLVSARGTGNLLTRTTAVLAALFMATAIALTVLSNFDRDTQSILDSAAQGGGEAGSVLDALDALQSGNTDTLPVPEGDGATGEDAAPDASSSSDAGDAPDLALPDAGEGQSGN